MKKTEILIIDDSPLITERLKEILNDMSAIGSITQAGTFAEGLRLLEEHKPGIVLLDINLPDKSGLELLRLIRLRGIDVTVIMVTNMGSDLYRITCTRLGADYFFDKSHEFEHIPGIIAGLRLTKPASRQPIYS